MQQHNTERQQNNPGPGLMAYMQPALRLSPCSVVNCVTCVHDPDRREAVEAHSLTHYGEGGGDETLAANQGPSCGQHKAWPVDRLGNSLHNTDSKCSYIVIADV